MIRKLFPLFGAGAIRRKDKDGRDFQIHLYEGQEWIPAAVRGFYEDFAPKGAAQGLPPHGWEQRRSWIDSLLSDGINLVVTKGAVTVGHATLMDVKPGQTCEYLIFVHPAQQNRGIGTAVTETVVSMARELGYRTIWLTVEVNNMRAIRVYEKTGFRMIGPIDVEREMIRELETTRPDAPPVT